MINFNIVINQINLPNGKQITVVAYVGLATLAAEHIITIFFVVVGFRTNSLHRSLFTPDGIVTLSVLHYIV